MAVLRWDPWGELATMQRDMQDLVGRRGFGPRDGGTFVPAIDAYRDDQGMVVRLELPGMSTEDIDVQIEEGVLTVRGERRFDNEIEDDAWIRRERRYGQFERSFTLPEGTDVDSISADMNNGVLEINVPHPPERQPRRIEVASGKQSGLGSGEVVDVE